MQYVRFGAMARIRLSSDRTLSDVVMFFEWIRRNSSTLIGAMLSGRVCIRCERERCVEIEKGNGNRHDDREYSKNIWSAPSAHWSLAECGNLRKQDLGNTNHRKSLSRSFWITVLYRAMVVGLKAGHSLLGLFRNAKLFHRWIESNGKLAQTCRRTHSIDFREKDRNVDELKAHRSCILRKAAEMRSGQYRADSRMKYGQESC
jgi:hypothetical protein